MESAARDKIHDFGGELVFIFQDGHKRFISWSGEPVQYAIGFKNTSYFLPDASLSDFDVSDSAMWKDLIGQDVSLELLLLTTKS